MSYVGATLWSMSHDAEAQRLVELHAQAVATDRSITTSTDVQASLDAHAEHATACEAFRRSHYPRTSRVVAVFGQVFTVSGRSGAPEEHRLT